MDNESDKGPYRSAELVERCACEDPVAGRCACCDRPQCMWHLGEGMCVRCTEAVRRELKKREVVPVIAGGATFVSVTLGLLLVAAYLERVTRLVSSLFVGLAAIPAGVTMAVLAMRATRRALRALTIWRIRPVLATYKGDLPPEPRHIDDWFSSNDPL